jgi:hypothetical protein
MFEVDLYKRPTYRRRDIAHDWGKAVESGLSTMRCTHRNETPPKNRRILTGDNFGRTAFDPCVTNRRFDVELSERAADLVNTNSAPDRHGGNEGFRRNAATSNNMRQ